jgi:hypothetical protein
VENATVLEVQAVTVPGIRQVLLPDQGPVLPLGIDGAHERDFSFKRWNLAKEKELGERRRNQPNANLGDWASVLLSEMLVRLGPHDFPKLNEAERRLILSQMYMQDVLYLYFWLRYTAMGPALSIKMECPFHEYKFDWPGDLRTMIVRVPDTLDAARWEFKLESPFPLRGSESKKWSLGPVRWSAIEQSNIGRRVNQGKIKAIMIHASILRVDGREIAIAEHELDEMTKLDLERHIGQIDSHAVGPDLSLDVRCPDPKCDRRWTTSLDWSYDSFFSISSR